MNQTEAYRIDEHLANAQASFALAENALLKPPPSNPTESDEPGLRRVHRLLMELVQLRLDFREKHRLYNFSPSDVKNDGPMSDVVDAIANRR